jgi:hypothetical protein
MRASYQKTSLHGLRLRKASRASRTSGETTTRSHQNSRCPDHIRVGPCPPAPRCSRQRTERTRAQQVECEARTPPIERHSPESRAPPTQGDPHRRRAEAPACGARVCSRSAAAPRFRPIPNHSWMNPSTGPDRHRAASRTGQRCEKTPTAAGPSTPSPSQWRRRCGRG